MVLAVTAAKTTPMPTRAQPVIFSSNKNPSQPQCEEGAEIFERHHAGCIFQVQGLGHRDLSEQRQPPIPRAMPH